MLPSAYSRCRLLGPAVELLRLRWEQQVWMGSVPCACVLVSPLYVNRLWMPNSRISSQCVCARALRNYEPSVRREIGHTHKHTTREWGAARPSRRASETEVWTIDVNGMCELLGPVVELLGLRCKKINRSHTHTHTPTENNPPDTDTHAHDKNNTPNPQTNTSHTHLTTLEGSL